MEKGRYIYRVERVQVSQPGPLPVADLASAVAVVEIESGKNPKVAPLGAWAAEHATPDFPALDWRKEK